MAYKGEPLHKRMVQAGLNRLGYKLVRLKSYERRDVPATSGTRGFSKLFCIGFNKTGTTSVEQVLKALGFRMPKQLEQERLLAPALDGLGHDRLAAFVRDHDAFQDLPFSQGQTYIVADALFPESRFILTVRDPQKWATSYIRYYRKDLGIEVQTPSEETFLGKSLYLEPGYMHRVMRQLLVEYTGGAPRVRWDLAFDRDFLIEAYQRRNHDIRRYFAMRPDDLLELDVSAEPDTGRLLRFLGVADRPAEPFPHANRNP